jgi:hypothetical protein
MHFDGGGTTIAVTHSNIFTSAYGLMLYAGNGVDLTYNNWSNDIDVSTMPGATGDVSFGYFEKGKPTAVAGTLTANNLSATKRLDTGPGAPR